MSRMCHQLGCGKKMFYSLQQPLSSPGPHCCCKSLLSVNPLMLEWILFRGGGVLCSGWHRSPTRARLWHGGSHMDGRKPLRNLMVKQVKADFRHKLLVLSSRSILFLILGVSFTFPQKHMSRLNHCVKQTKKNNIWILSDIQYYITLLLFTWIILFCLSSKWNSCLIHIELLYYEQRMLTGHLRCCLSDAGLFLSNHLELTSWPVRQRCIEVLSRPTAAQTKSNWGLVSGGQRKQSRCINKGISLGAPKGHAVAAPHTFTGEWEVLAGKYEPFLCRRCILDEAVQQLVPQRSGELGENPLQHVLTSIDIKLQSLSAFHALVLWLFIFFILRSVWVFLMCWQELMGGTVLRKWAYCDSAIFIHVSGNYIEKGAFCARRWRQAHTCCVVYTLEEE